MQPTTPRKLLPGNGCITVSLHGDRAVFSELSSTYPLKLMSPGVQGKTVAVYIITYGGGLVSGDEINIGVNIETGVRLLLLSQGSTKVFKSRPGARLARSRASPATSRVDVSGQNHDFHIAPNSCLFLLPEPVTCFRDASYHQSQKFYIQGNGSAVILDWITSGRISMGEEWVFSRYHSLTEVFHDGKRIVKDAMLLDNEASKLCGDRIPERSLRDKMHPYACYAMIILYGPQVQSIVADITARYDQISVFKTKVPDRLVWSLSPIDSENQGVVVRVAGIETETVKDWLKQTLSGLETMIGRDMYKRVFP